MAESVPARRPSRQFKKEITFRTVVPSGIFVSDKFNVCGKIWIIHNSAPQNQSRGLSFLGSFIT